MNKLQYRTTGRFYFGRSEEQAQYVFSLRDDAPKELQRSFLIGLEKDNNFSGSALEVANEIKEVIDSYWINSDKSKIKDLVEYLEIWGDKDEYDGLIAERNRITERLSKIENKLCGYEAEEWDNWKPELLEEGAPK